MFYTGYTRDISPLHDVIGTMKTNKNKHNPQRDVVIIFGF